MSVCPSVNALVWYFNFSQWFDERPHKSFSEFILPRLTTPPTLTIPTDHPILRPTPLVAVYHDHPHHPDHPDPLTTLSTPLHPDHQDQPDYFDHSVHQTTGWKYFAMSMKVWIQKDLVEKYECSSHFPLSFKTPLLPCSYFQRVPFCATAHKRPFLEHKLHSRVQSQNFLFSLAIP